MQGLPAGSATLSFAEDLLSRIPQTSAAPNAYRQQERAAAELVRRNASYAMVMDEDEDDAAPAPADLPAPTTGKAPKQKEKHVRKSKVGVILANWAVRLGHSRSNPGRAGEHFLEAPSPATHLSGWLFHHQWLAQKLAD